VTGIYGPQTVEVEALLGRITSLTPGDVERLVAAWDIARDAAWDAAGGAAGALVVRDLIGSYGVTQAHYDALTGPWRKTIGRLHPDDVEVDDTDREEGR
jgi:hypothetical protein